jgi:PAS domain S-box-containing protein
MSDPQQTIILNVDDDETGRYATSHVLQGAGFVVLEAATGQEALRLAREAHPHLVILDVNLPDMSGFEVCRALKADPTTAAIPVLHLSAVFVKSEDRVAGLENGADAYLVQPVEPAELLAAVRALLRLRRAEEALWRSETLAQRLLQAMPDALVVVDGTGHIVLVNAQSEPMFGYSQEELLGASVEVLLPERFHELHAAHRAAYTATPRQRAMGTGLGLFGRRQDGSEFPVDVSLSPLQTPDGLLVISVIRDVTERQQAEEALRRSRDRYRSLVLATSQTVWRTNADGEVVDDLPSWRNLTGQSAEEIKGWGWLGAVHPEDRARIVQGQAYALATRSLFEVEYRLRTRDGSYRHLLVRGAPVLEPDGRIREWVGTWTDITARKRAEEALQARETLLRLLLDNIPVAIAYVDKTRCYRFANRVLQEWFGLPSAAIVGKQVTDVIGAAAYQVLRSAVEQVLAGTEVSFEALVPYRYGGVRHVNTRYVPHLDAHGGVLGYFALSEDTTRRRHLEEQVRQMQKMEAIGTLAGGIAHDFNNILSAIMGYTDLTLEDVPQGSVAWRNLQEVLTASTRARDLVQQILTFSRQTEHERKPVHLDVIVKEVMRLLRATLPATIEIRQVIGRDVGTVMADPTQLHQVLMNLCTNAEHAMRESGGQLEVRLEALEVDQALASDHPELEPGPYVRLSVQDTGHGISPEILERIFEPFFTTKGVGEGTGMGLAVVHGIVTSHGGAITVESTPGKGTTFVVYLPRSESGASASMPLEEPMQGEGECILFVDDEEPLARLGQEMLVRLGYEVVVRTSSVEALEAFRAAPQRFDLVITDQTMPNLTGEALARKLRCLQPDIPLILCTGFSHTMTQEKARALGIDAFLMKPLTRRDLGRTIRDVLTRRQAPES